MGRVCLVGGGIFGGRGWGIFGFGSLVRVSIAFSRFWWVLRGAFVPKKGGKLRFLIAFSPQTEKETELT